MSTRPKNSLGPLVLYHGCDKNTAESVLSGEETLLPSENDYDWLAQAFIFGLIAPIVLLSGQKIAVTAAPEKWENHLS